MIKTKIYQVTKMKHMRNYTCLVNKIKIDEGESKHYSIPPTVVSIMELL